MSREVVVHIWCDGICAEQEQSSPAAVEQRVIVDNKTMLLDLCETCAKVLVAPLEEAARARGRRADSEPTAAKVKASTKKSSMHDRPDGLTTCLECGFDAVSPQGLSLHLTRTHISPGPRIEEPKSCLYCEHVSPTGAGMANHVATAHPEEPAYVGKRSKVNEEPRVGEFDCPDCDFVAITMAGLGSHRQAKHGYSSARRQVE